MGMKCFENNLVWYCVIKNMCKEFKGGRVLSGFGELRGFFGKVGFFWMVTVFLGIEEGSEYFYKVRF